VRVGKQPKSAAAVARYVVGMVKHKHSRCKPKKRKPNGRRLATLADIIAMESRIMTNLDDLKTELGRINTATTEIANDLKAAIAAAGDAPSAEQWAEFKTQITESATALEAVAASYPPAPPTESARKGR